jgi:hypothetical protein
MAASRPTPSIKGQHLIFFTFRVIVVRDAGGVSTLEKKCARGSANTVIC